MSCDKTTSNVSSNCILQLNVNLNISWWIDNGKLNYIINSTPELKVEPLASVIQQTTLNTTLNSTLNDSNTMLPPQRACERNPKPDQPGRILSPNISEPLALTTNRYDKYELRQEESDCPSNLEVETEQNCKTSLTPKIPLFQASNESPHAISDKNNSNIHNKVSCPNSEMKCVDNAMIVDREEPNYICDSSDEFSNSSNDVDVDVDVDVDMDIDETNKNNFILTPMYIRTLFPYSKDIIYENLKMTEVGLYSISNRHDSGTLTRILNQCILSWNLKTNSIVVTDGTAGIGGNSIAFGMMFKKVNAIEIDDMQHNALINNVQVYNLNNVNCYLGNCLKIIPSLNQHIIFLDPPWGGKLYKKEKKLDLYLSGIPLVYIVNLWKKKCKNLEMIALKIPKNFSLSNFAKECEYPFLYLLFFRKYNVLILSNRLCKPIEHRHFREYIKKRRNSI
jgi:hypothetical protein